MRQGIVRAIDPSNLQSLSHPSHKQQWLQLAGVLGRAMADKDFDRFGKEEQDDKDRRTVCPVLQ